MRSLLRLGRDQPLTPENARDRREGGNGLKAKLPAKAIISVAYNTSGYGAEPQGYATACAGKAEGCFYDSLNVALETATTVGEAPLRAEEKDYFSSVEPGEYCDGGTAGTATFRLDSPSTGCWGEYQPAIEVKAAE